MLNLNHEVKIASYDIQKKFSHLYKTIFLNYKKKKEC